MNTNKHTHPFSPCLILLYVFINILSTGCYRNDIRTETIDIPTLGSEQCSTYLEANLVQIRGIQKITGDPAAQQAQITFNARKMSLRNVEHHIARLGFDVNARHLQHKPDKAYKIPGNPKAKQKLPKECQ